MAPFTLMAIGHTYLAGALLISLAAVMVYLATRFLPGGGSPLGWLRGGQLLVVTSLVLPVLMASLPHDGGALVAAQVFGGGSVSPGSLHIVAALGSASPTTAPSARIPTAALGVGAGLLLLGIGVALGRLLVGMWQLRRYLNGLTPLHRMGRVSVVVEPGPGIPFSTGLFHRWVVLPLPLMVEHPHLFRVALHHELRHHRHGDTLWQIVLEGVRALYFWLPPVRSLQRDLGLLAELACDDAVIHHKKMSASSYGHCLLEVATLMPGQNLLPTAACMVTLTQNSQLTRRIRMLLSPASRNSSTTFGLVLCLSLATFAGTAWATSELVVDRQVDKANAEKIAARVSTPDFEVAANSQVQTALAKLVATAEGQEFMRTSLSRMSEYKPLIVQKLSEAGLPSQLLAVPLIESGFVNMDTTSKEMSLAPGMRGAGVWMFIPTTAEAYGLKVNRRVDERLDVSRETDAAVHLFSDLYKQFGSWPLALAGYNQGANAVSRAITESGGERDVYKLIDGGKLNNYVPTIMAGVIVLNEPSLVQ